MEKHSLTQLADWLGIIQKQAKPVATSGPRRTSEIRIGCLHEGKMDSKFWQLYKYLSLLYKTS